MHKQHHFFNWRKSYSLAMSVWNSAVQKPKGGQQIRILTKENFFVTKAYNSQYHWQEIEPIVNIDQNSAIS